jgi:DNA polymerase-3 subunit delta'
MGFDSFVANAKAVAAVRDLLATGRVPHGLLFAGPEGVGKRTLAIMLAKALNCERLRDDFCGDCARCQRAQQMLDTTRRDLAARRDLKDSARHAEGFIYFDLQVIEPLTRYILIEQIRQLRSVAYTRPFELPRRVFIIDQAQAVHWQAVDLLLKILEEPPETTILILVCPNPYELRPTIRSRCRRIQFLPVDDATLFKVLEEEGRVPKSERALVARLAAGSVAKAKSFDLGTFRLRRSPWVEFLDCVLAAAPYPNGNLNWKSVFESTRALSENRADLEEMLRIGYSILSDLLKVYEGQDDSRVVNLDLFSHLKQWAPKLGFKGIETLKNGLDEAYRLSSRNVNLQLGFDTLAIELQWLQATKVW